MRITAIKDTSQSMDVRVWKRLGGYKPIDIAQALELKQQLTSYLFANVDRRTIINEWTKQIYDFLGKQANGVLKEDVEKVAENIYEDNYYQCLDEAKWATEHSKEMA